MRSSRVRLQDDLRGLLAGEVFCDDVTRTLYAADAGIGAWIPEGVVFPRGVEDVVACVRYAVENKITLHPRGAGTARSGGCVGKGIVLDMTRFMRRLIRTDATSVTAQAGATRFRVNQMLMRHQKRFFAPDPGAAHTTTFGGLIASDGAGPHWLRYGFPRQNLVSLQAVLASGDVVEINRNSLPTRSVAEIDEWSHGVALARSIVHRGCDTIVDSLHALLSDAANSLQHSLPREKEALTQVPWRSGYHINEILTGARGDTVDLLSLLAGSEGTLAIFTEMTLATTPLPRVRVGGIFLCHSLDRAARVLPLLQTFAPSRCEMLDRRQLTLLRESDSTFVKLIPNTHETEAALLIEWDGDDENLIREELNALAEILTRENLIHSARFTQNAEDGILFQRLCDAVPLALLRMEHPLPLIPLFEDVAVPLESFSSFLAKAQTLFQRRGLTVSIGGHWGHGHLRFQPLLASLDSTALDTLAALAQDLYAEIWSCGGSIVSENSWGRIHTSWLAQQSPERIPILQQIKNIFDPAAILNPGVIIHDGSDWRAAYRTQTGSSSQHTALLYSSLIKTPNARDAAVTPEKDKEEVTKRAAHSAALHQLQMQLKWDVNSAEVNELARVVERCTQCGQCRTRAAGVRMCPTFRVHGTETSAPRACVSLMKSVLADPDALVLLTTERAQRVADLCIHCQRCCTECAAQVDIPRLAFRIKSAYVSAHGLTTHERILVHIDSWLKFLSWISCPVNWAFSNRAARWLMEKLFGVPQQRKLPALTKFPFMTRVLLGGARLSSHKTETENAPKNSSQHSPKNATKKVALFVDTYANHFAPQIAHSAIAVLEHNGIEVQIPYKQRHSGLVAFACGDSDTATSIAARNAAVFAHYIRQGYTVVTLEPASASCLTREYRYIADALEHRDDLDLLMTHTLELTAYLWKLHEAGELRTDFKPICYHAPRAQGIPKPRFSDRDAYNAISRAPNIEHDTCENDSAPLMVIGYHAPCRSLSHTAISTLSATPAEKLLQLLPNTEVRRIERGCCGLGNSYGLRKKSYHDSLRLAMPLMASLRSADFTLAATECSICRMQLEQGCHQSIVHPITLLAHAYSTQNENAKSAF